MYVIVERVEYIAELGRLMRSVLLRKNTAYGTIYQVVRNTNYA